MDLLSLFLNVSINRCLTIFSVFIANMVNINLYKSLRQKLFGVLNHYLECKEDVNLWV